jgi:transposase
MFVTLTTVSSLKKFKINTPIMRGGTTTGMSKKLSINWMTLPLERAIKNPAGIPKIHDKKVANVADKIPNFKAFKNKLSFRSVLNEPVDRLSKLKLIRITKNITRR